MYNSNKFNEAYRSFCSILLKTTLLTLTIIFINQKLQAQVPGPEPEWKHEWWSAVDWNGTSQAQDNSGDDWWNNHTKLYDNGVHVGYVACGYATYDKANITNLEQKTCLSYSGPTGMSDDCHEDFEKTGDEKGFKMQVIARYDLNGDMLWCKRYNSGEFFKVIQDNNGDLIAIGESNFSQYKIKDNSGVFQTGKIGYNPSSGNTGAEADCANGVLVYSKKMNVVKTDIDGELTWTYSYGNLPGSTSIFDWMSESSGGKSLVEYNSGYRLVGSTSNVPALSPARLAGFMVHIDQNGKLSGSPNKQVYLFDSPNHPSNPNPVYFDAVFEDIKRSSSNHLAVSGRAVYVVSTPTIYIEDGDAIIVHFAPSASFNANLNVIPSNSTSTYEKAVYLEYLSNKDMFALPVFYSTNTGLGGGNSGEGDVDIHFFGGDFNSQAPLPAQPFAAGTFKAYDLKMGISETSNGFATVCSKQFTPTTYDQGVKNMLDNRFSNRHTSTMCTNYKENAQGNLNGTPLNYWDTDASIAKYEISTSLVVTKKWEKTFDVDNAPREFFPGNIKRQECLYSITADDSDGSLVIYGNSSSNFDDGYLAKLHNDDCIGLPYDIVDHSDYVYDITTNTPWSSNRTVLGKVVVGNGATLTISGASTVISFADTKLAGVKSQLIIEKGAKVIIDGATLTNDSRCPNSTWQGISIEGDNNFNQLPLAQPVHQGKLELKNGALIDNVQYAIIFGKEGQWGDFGGLVQAEDATIRVTRRAASFMSYPYTNHSSFRRCTFEYVTTITDPPISLVTIWNNNGIGFWGCTFIDNSGLNEYTEYGGNGIFSIDASYTVGPYCDYAAYPPGTPLAMPCLAQYFTEGSFTNLNQGIFVSSGGGTPTINVSETNFYDNSMAMRVDGVNNVRFVLNTVLTGGVIKNGYSTSIQPTQMGFYSKYSKGYEVEQNTFEERSSALEGVIGVNIINSGDVANEVYNNTFKFNTIGEKYEGLNRNPAFGPIEGLQFLCNDNLAGNGEDVNIIELNNSDDGIRDNQGSSTPANSASNLFLNSGNSNIGNNSSNLISYHYNLAATQEYPFQVTTGLVSRIDVSVSNTCPDRFWNTGTNGGVFDVYPMNSNFQGIVDDYYDERAIYNDLLYTYFQNIDNGNTDSLLTAIGLYFPGNAQTMRDDLMSEAPYVSEQALRDAAETGILTDALLLEVCLANPDATTNENFLDFVEFEIPNTLPSSMVQLIYQSWGGETPRTILENQLADLNANLGRVSSKLIHLYEMDSLDYTDSIRNMLESQKTLNSKYQLAELDLELGNFSTALTQLTAIQNNNALNVLQQAEHTNLVDYVNFRKDLQTAGTDYMRLNETQLTELRTIASANAGRSALLAQNILCFGYQECDFGTAIPQARVKSRRTYSEIPVVEKAINSITVSLSPNPAKEIVKISLEGLADGQVVQLSLKNTSGQVVLEKQLNATITSLAIDHLTKGVYLYEIRSNNDRISTGKLIVQ